MGKEVKQLHDESHLIQLLKSRDKAGMSMLYDNYSHALFAVINQVLNNQELSEDVLQECFIKIWKKIESFDSSKGRLYTWMLNIARNLSIDVTRSKDFKKSQKVQTIDNTVYGSEGTVDPINVDTIGLTDVVDQLKPEYQSIIKLIYFQGYTQKEVSEELDIPLGTVKTRVKAAIDKLRNVISR
tara:strand:- start:1473 stop:2024 length:552 start_codon:yes stop_codon:yes gene_type:complete